ncbi:hypothetical protein RHMOL_Rhmol13G0060600 [Rhododendron molle]|uniref:Uncharacterized protein n=1 Tax=Rhododendron molle TaxID=49168 RepID=A0ACC0L443_RHOML|nr:hypothetical protein RHMOL_Rhmol13G0060600 [Rhododendron molle]
MESLPSAVQFNTAAKKSLFLNARSNKRGKESKLMNSMGRRTSKRRIFLGIHNGEEHRGKMSHNRGIGTGREAEEPLEEHAVSSSPTGIATGTQRPEISNVEEPEEESEPG